MDELQKYRLRKTKRTRPSPQRIREFIESIGLKEDGLMITAFCQAVVVSWIEGAQDSDITELVRHISIDECDRLLDVKMSPGREELPDALAMIMYSGCHLRFKRMVKEADLEYLTKLLLEIMSETKGV